VREGTIRELDSAEDLKDNGDAEPDDDAEEDGPPY
jgi:hypothetical protein